MFPFPPPSLDTANMNWPVEETETDIQFSFEVGAEVSTHFSPKLAETHTPPPRQTAAAIYCPEALTATEFQHAGGSSGTYDQLTAAVTERAVGAWLGRPEGLGEGTTGECSVGAADGREAAAPR